MGTAEIRDKMVELGGQQFTATDLPKCANLHALLGTMVRHGEIAVTSTVSTSGRPKKMYRVIRLKAVCAAKSDSQADSKMYNWFAVYPEFFRPPSMTGRVSMVNKMSQHSEED